MHGSSSKSSSIVWLISMEFKAMKSGEIKEWLTDKGISLDVVNSLFCKPIYAYKSVVQGIYVPNAFTVEDITGADLLELTSEKNLCDLCTVCPRLKDRIKLRTAVLQMNEVKKL